MNTEDFILDSFRHYVGCAYFEALVLHRNTKHEAIDECAAEMGQVNVDHANPNAPDESLLRPAHDAANGATSEPRDERTQSLVGFPTRLHKRIGQNRIKSVIASGGMGTVYEAVQEKPRRTVALKLMKHGIASRSALRRFEYESQILARLRHPGIAQVSGLYTLKGRGVLLRVTIATGCAGYDSPVRCKCYTNLLSLWCPPVRTRNARCGRRPTAGAVYQGKVCRRMVGSEDPTDYAPFPMHKKIC